MDRIEAYVDKGNFIRSKRERTFLRNFCLICEFLSQTYNLDLRKQFAKTLFTDSGKRYWESLGAHGEKGNILTKLLERIFLRDCFLMCDFNTQSSTLPFLGHFTNTVVVDSAEVYLGAH